MVLSSSSSSSSSIVFFCKLIEEKEEDDNDVRGSCLLSLLLLNKCETQILSTSRPLNFNYDPMFICLPQSKEFHLSLYLPWKKKSYSLMVWNSKLTYPTLLKHVVLALLYRYQFPLSPFYFQQVFHQGYLQILTFQDKVSSLETQSVELNSFDFKGDNGENRENGDNGDNGDNGERGLGVTSKRSQHHQALIQWYSSTPTLHSFLIGKTSCYLAPSHVSFLLSHPWEASLLPFLLAYYQLRSSTTRFPEFQACLSQSLHQLTMYLKPMFSQWNKNVQLAFPAISTSPTSLDSKKKVLESIRLINELRSLFILKILELNAWIQSNEMEINEKESVSFILVQHMESLMETLLEKIRTTFPFSSSPTTPLPVLPSFREEERLKVKDGGISATLHVPRSTSSMSLPPPLSTEIIPPPLSQLMEMGFPMEEAQIALYLNKNQVDPALQMLLETPEVIHRHLISPTTPTSHPAQTSFFTSSPPLTPTSSRPRHSSASYSPDPTTPRSGLHALPRMDDRPRSTSTSTSTSSSSSSSSRPFSLPKTFMQGKLAQWWSSTLQSPTHPSTVSPSTSSLGRTGSLPPKSRSFDPLPFPSKRSRWTPQWATYVMVVGTQRQQRFELTLLCHPDPFHLLKSLSHGVPFMKETTSEPEPTTKTKKNELKSSGHGTTVLPFKSNRFHPVRVFVHYFPTLSSYHAWTSSTSTSTSTTATATATTTASTQFHETSPSHSRERAWLLKQDKPKEKVEEEEEEDQDEDEEGDWLFQDVLWKELSTGSPLSSLSSSSSLFPSLKKETPLSHSSSSSTFLQPLPTYACLRHPLCWDHQVSLTPVIGPTQFHEVMMSMLLRYGEEGGVVPPHGHPHLPSTSFNLAWTVPLLDLQEVEKTLKILRACWTTYTRWNVPLQNKSKTKTKMKMKMKMKMKSKLHHELVVPLSTSSTLTSSSIPFQRNDFKNNHGLKKKTNPLPTTKTKVTKDEEKGTETEEVKNTPRLSRVVEEVHEIDDDDDDDEEEEEETTKKQKGTLRMNEEDVTTKGRVGPHVLVCLPSQFEKVQSLIQTVFKTSFQTQP